MMNFFCMMTKGSEADGLAAVAELKNDDRLCEAAIAAKYESAFSVYEEWKESFFGLHWENIDEDISFESFNWEDNDPVKLYHHA